MTDDVIRSFCAQQREWLDLELQSEQQEQSSATGTTNGKNRTTGTNEEARSNVLQNLYASDISVGLYGRTVVRLMSVTSDASSSEGLLLPAHRFTSGDEVEIHSKTKSQGAGGVVSEVTETSLSVALFSSNRNNKSTTQDRGDGDDNDIFSQTPLRLLPKSSIEVHRKYLAALQELERNGTQHPVAGHVIRALFDSTVDTPPPPQTVSDSLRSDHHNLDDSQLEAISFCLSDHRPISLIHGPPGTGKTTTVAALIREAVQQGQKVLVTAPSNVAVDNVLSKLVEEQQQGQQTPKKKQPSNQRRLRVVRLGHPARLQPQILPYSLEALVQGADGTEIVADVRAELQQYLNILAKPKSRGNDKRVAYREVKSLRKEIRTREEKVVTELLASAQVILATCVGAGNRILKDTAFDLVVIDEAAQALEAACWIPVLKAKKVVLAGDHCQLPPTIKSNMPRVTKGLGTTMFERLMELYGDSESSGGKLGRISRMLRVQYRMHEQIANWASQEMYGGQLQTHDSVRHRTLKLLTGSSSSDVAETTMLLVDTAGCDMYETVNASGSRLNTGESQIVAQHVRELLEMGVRQEQLAIISPYNGQVEVLRAALLPDAPKLEIRSVDGFQGGEREAVVLSLVRSSERGGMDGIGFLRDDRRLNVAVTRAKRHCCVICDSETVSKSPFVKNLINWIEGHGETRSALEFISATNEYNVESDLLEAESELQRMSQQPEDQPVRVEKDDGKKNDDKQKAILEKIENFVRTATPGDKMTLSSELSKFDRKMVHEFAEKYGITHLSEGQDGVDRRITIIIPAKEIAHSNDADGEGPVDGSAESGPIENSGSPETRNNEGECALEESKPVISTFAALQEDDEDDAQSSTEEKTPEQEKELSEQATSNNLLADLARERAERQRKSNTSKAESTVSSKKSKSKKKKGQKLGGKAHASKATQEEEDNLDGLDDMAFLDAQIDKVQNSHGRKVAGKGSYRTVMNGILISKPEAREKKKNTAASAALQSKLKQAQNDRKAKKKK